LCERADSEDRKIRCGQAVEGEEPPYHECVAVERESSAKWGRFKIYGMMAARNLATRKFDPSRNWQLLMMFKVTAIAKIIC
jgi:hypothetical protein